MRIILDTNVLINAGQSGDYNHGNRIIQWVIDGELTALMSPQTRREHERILERELTRPEEQEQLRQFLLQCEEVAVDERVRVVAEDPEDDKFFSLAASGDADVIITNDRHLLDVESYGRTQVMTPDAFVAHFEEVRDPQGQSRWAEWVRGVLK